VESLSTQNKLTGLSKLASLVVELSISKKFYFVALSNGGKQLYNKTELSIGCSSASLLASSPINPPRLLSMTRILIV
jgi:hypothetical protein